MKNKKIIYAVAFITIMLGIVSMWQRGELGDDSSIVGKLKFIKNDNTEKVIDIKVADTVAEREKGLMFVQSMPENTGMLFIYDYVSIKKMWMKNTYIPLDMFFISEDLVIKNIAKNTVPHSLSEISSILPVKYVLEVNSGFASRNNININDKIEYFLDN